MPTLPTRIAPRQVNQNRVGLSSTALSFLIPLFVVFILVPICLVFFISKRRRNLPIVSARNAHYKRGGKPVVRREDAKRELEGVTKIVDANEGLSEKMTCAEKEQALDTSSVLERECAICLSSLHAPSPPEPAKIAAATVSNPVDAAAATRAPSVTGQSLEEAEQILHLNVCGHEFHAECLTSWFIIGKYSCPICRAVYYERESGTEGEV